jgi:hypothetical protein
MKKQFSPALKRLQKEFAKQINQKKCSWLLNNLGLALNTTPSFKRLNSLILHKDSEQVKKKLLLFSLE